MQESRNEPERYKCEKCARNYKWKSTLSAHQKYECGVTPQFNCEFCSRRFTWNGSLRRHIVNLHSERSIPKKVHNCDKCTRSFSSTGDLNNHKGLNHAEFKPQFICDYCGHKSKQKVHLEKHIIIRHLK